MTNPTAIALRHPRRPDLVALITASANESGRYQLTWMDGQGPSGHTTRDTAEEAVRHAVDEGYRLDAEATPTVRDRVIALEAQDAHAARVAEIEAWLRA